MFGNSHQQLQCAELPCRCAGFASVCSKYTYSICKLQLSVHTGTCEAIQTLHGSGTVPTALVVLEGVVCAASLVCCALLEFCLLSSKPSRNVALQCAFTSVHCNLLSQCSATGGAALASAGDSSILIWDVATGKIRRKLSGHKQSVCSLAAFKDGRTLVSGSFDKKIMMWDTTHAGDAAVSLSGHTDDVNTLAVLGDGVTVASGGGGGRMILWSDSSKP